LGHRGRNTTHTTHVIGNNRTQVQMGQVKNDKPFHDWIDQRDCLRLVLRDWSLALSAVELRVVLFVYDRTAGWGKEWERVTLDHLTKGVWGKDGTCFASPASTNRRTAQATIAQLVQRGVLLAKPHSSSPRAKQYSLNQHWEPSMKVPKRIREQREVTVAELPLLDGGKSATINSGKTATMKRKESKEEGNSEECCSGAATGMAKAMHQQPPSRPAGQTREELLAVATQVKARSRAKRAAAMDKGRKLRGDGSGFHPTKAAVDATWLHLWQDNYGDEPLAPLTRVARQILWDYWAKWTMARQAGEFGEYLRWLFENWQALRVGTFAWMKDFPKVPVANMVVSSKLRTAFELAYREKEKIAQWRKQAPHERELARLVDEQGMDPEAAEQLVEQRMGQADQMKELRQEMKRLAYEKETVKRQRQAAAKPATGSGKPKPLAKNEGWRDPY
jgi:hypothetical protein